jgi:hypothetical protein
VKLYCPTCDTAITIRGDPTECGEHRAFWQRRHAHAVPKPRPVEHPCKHIFGYAGSPSSDIVCGLETGGDHFCEAHQNEPEAIRARAIRRAEQRRQRELRLNGAA